MNGRDGTTTFLPLESRIGGQGRCIHPSVGQFLTREQTRFIYRKVDTGEIINIDKIEQEIDQDKLLDWNDMSREINSYQDLMVSNEEKIGPLIM